MFDGYWGPARTSVNLHLRSCQKESLAGCSGQVRHLVPSPTIVEGRQRKLTELYVMVHVRMFSVAEDMSTARDVSHWDRGHLRESTEGQVCSSKQQGLRVQVH